MTAAPDISKEAENGKLARQGQKFEDLYVRLREALRKRNKRKLDEC